MKTKIQILITLILFASAFGCNSVDKGFYDENAIQALDKLSETIGNLNSCSFTVNTEVVEPVNEVLVPSLRQNDVYMRGSDKMYFYMERDSIRKGFWYDGSQLATFLFDENQYDVIDAPGSIIETIDSVSSNFRIDFPASDFFYPTLTDDLIAQFDTLVVLGTKSIGEVACTEINARNPNLDVYILIEEATHLPKQLEIYYLGEKKGESYVGTFSNFKTNPNLPDELFMFTPPSNSVKASLFK